MLFIRNHMDVDTIDILRYEMLRQDLPQSAGQLLVGRQLGLDLLCGEHGPAVRESHDVAGVEHPRVPARQHLQSGP